MHITIIGAGAMGCLFGGLLSEHGIPVHLLDIWPQQVQALNNHGLTIVRNGQKRTFRVTAHRDPEAIGRTDLAIIFVKHGQTAQAAQTAHSLLGKNGHVLTLQNGMGNAEIISEIVGGHRVLCGTTAQGAMLLGPGRIQHSGEGPTLIGMWTGEPSSFPAQVAGLFSRAGIATDTVEKILPVLWRKLLVNVGINAITALTGIRNGQLLDLDQTRALVADAVNEAASVAKARGIPVESGIVDHVFDVARATGPNRSSMGQDVDAGRMTEIGAINGYIVRQAETAGMAAPVNATLTRLIETLQAHYRDSSAKQSS